MIALCQDQSRLCMNLRPCFWFANQQNPSHDRLSKLIRTRTYFPVIVFHFALCFCALASHPYYPSITHMQLHAGKFFLHLLWVDSKDLPRLLFGRNLCARCNEDNMLAHMLAMMQLSQLFAFACPSSGTYPNKRLNYGRSYLPPKPHVWCF